MKKLIALSMVLCTLNATAKLGSTDKVKYAGDLAYANFCEAVVKDDVNMLKKSVRSKIGVVARSNQSVLKKLTAENGMSCNGVDLLSFSEQRNASKVFDYLTSTK
ncbi:DUF3718 domain-containing protein [Paraglaciecola arctica]|uniref:DUF3718 domain-containing protein n=1 Tax=Paraglaciecola arctica TaxID=1128911 RepID=UPI001C06FFB2|nr:DUF3718 domain-containing protein [Paraglaciecola arctica]MBU3004848.1 DUF3718 domain-containing protein [Paraglaciecola arctica]